jgi:thiamine biosynthesis lipoprotein
MSVSGIRGKFFEAEGKILGHILDPRTGQPAGGTELAAVVLPSATETDALSTALLIRGSEAREAIERLRPGTRTFLVPFSI